MPETILDHLNNALVAATQLRCAIREDGTPDAEYEALCREMIVRRLEHALSIARNPDLRQLI